MKFTASYWIPYIVVCLSFVSLPSGTAQITQYQHLQTIENIVKVLKQEGLQNISVRRTDEGYIVAYENRVYRYDLIALRRVLQLVAEFAIDDAEQLIVVTKRNNIPQISTKLSLVDYKSYIQGLITTESLVKNIEITQDIVDTKAGELVVENANSGNYRAELVIRPYLTAELGNKYLTDQFIHLIDLRPKLNVYLWKGAHFTYEFILPISNEFKEQAPHWGELRSRIISLSQEVRLPENIFLNASIGVFSRDRYGGSLAVGKYFWNGRFLATGKIGYTGHASYVRYDAVFNQIKKGWAYTDMDYLDYKVGVSTWIPNRNLQLGVSYGKVLNDRKVLRVDIKQKFQELELGLFAFKTDEGRNYGVEVSIPIFPKKYWKPKLFSVRPSRKFRYEYLGNLNLAREYQAQGMYDGFPQDLNPNFIKFQILKGLD